MAVNTILLDFAVDKDTVADRHKRELALMNIESALNEFVRNTTKKDFIEMPGGFLQVLTADRGTFITVRGFVQGLISINVEYFREENEPPLFNYELSGNLQEVLSEKLQSTKSRRLPAIKRGTVDRYFVTSDERLLEYDIDEVLFEEKSPYQKVQIVHSKSFGNLLLLDDLQNLSEKDLVYTETLMQRGKENYRDKEIVILGGGDGALLWELLKEQPKFVTMLELDKVVMDACKKYMRSACGNCLDNYNGANYEIIVGDCVKVLDNYIKEGRKFDYVFGDLTDLPISPTPQGEIWDFIRLILKNSLKVLKPDGKYMTHANGASNPDSLVMFEHEFKKLQPPVCFTQDRAFVPSFMEDWVFYQVSFQK
ncbi:spermine synthase isoform X2 [Thrips palmi]|uniref:Spermine synthase isoform X2 n=1 Tax=Thrips palmi TaxID=161013 RepID=A0A6P8YPR2_THRPL|nr:spermine synthase isoform X2 [Thrips palmi]